MKNIKEIPRISIDLLELKPLECLQEVYQHFKIKLTPYFDAKGSPLPNFFEDTACPLCLEKQYEVKFISDFFRYVQCQNCLSIYNNPRLKESILEEMYQKGDYTVYFKKLTVSSQAIRKQLIDVRKFEQISACFEKPGSLLDVGCGSGSFLKVCQEKGWQVFGMDPSEAAVNVALKDYGLEVVNGFFEKYEFGGKRFDCITFWGIFEHLVNPMAALEKSIGLLKKNGLLVFEVPSADSYLMNYLQNYQSTAYRFLEPARHLLFFSHKGIEQICQKQGLALEYMETNGLDVQTILPYEFSPEIRTKLLNMQRCLDLLMQGDHFRVFLRKKA